MPSDRSNTPAKLAFKDVVTRPAMQAAPSGARLTVFGAANLSHPVPDGTILTIGRSLDADLCLEDPALSRIHAQVTFGAAGPEGSGLKVRDLGSSNGTRLRGEKISANVDRDFEPGDLIDMGNCTLVVQRDVNLEHPRRVWTHGFFQLRLEDECQRAKSSGHPLAIIRVRIRGNEATTQVESALTGWLGQNDGIGEYAPGEYDILLSESGPDAAAQAMQGIRFALGRLNVDVDIGMACLPRDGQDSEVLIAKAGADIRKSVTPPSDTPFVVESRAMRQLHELIERIAPSDLTVLILGETGAGKEVIAQSVHARSGRPKTRFVALNCGAFPEHLLESELFGHEKGAFTGAIKSKPGLLESAQGGTVFLDEVAEMSLTTQVKLLRVIEERQVRRLGGLKTNPIDVRLVAATNKDLTKLIEQGAFREDLYYRINGITVIVPPLRERPEEIPMLAAYFARQAMARDGLERTVELAPEAMKKLCAYSWPGNVRELKNVIERAVVLAGDGPIQLAHLPTEKLRSSVIYQRTPGGPRPSSVEMSAVAVKKKPDRSKDKTQPTVEPPQNGDRLQDAIANLERERIVAALEACAGNQSKAAKQLGMSRKTLIRRLDQYNIPRPRKGRTKDG